jgi:hypothetical protein
MRIVNGKISFWAFLPVFAPADTGGGTQESGQQSGQESQQQGNENKGQSKELDPDSDNILEDLMGSDESGDDDDIDINFDQDDDEDPEEQQRIADSSKNLGTMLKQKIAGMGLKAEDIPADFDPSDRAQVADLLGKTNRQVAEQVISTIPEILKHALSIVVPQLEKKIQSASVSTSKKQEATKAFSSLGLKGSDKTLGLSIYKAAIGKGFTPEKAARATQKALSGLRGGSEKPFNNGNGNKKRSDGGNGVLEGSDALDAMFGRN